MVLTGGLDLGNFNVTTSTLQYNTKNGSFSPLPNLNIARCDHSSLSFVNRLYVVAGKTKSTLLKSIEFLDIQIED